MRLLRKACDKDGLLGSCILMEIKIPAPAERIIEELRANGHEAYIVGGCVRDMLLGREPGDWDITTSALPQEVKNIFRRTVDTGILHGTVTVLMGKEGFEVTTFRVDGEYLDGRHPSSVAFTPSLEEDLKRRDFTINAMAWSRDTGLVDLFGGEKDLKDGVIRCVGAPMDRFSEDALRILRAIRFSAQLNFVIEEETYRAIEVIGPNLLKVSKERIQVELTKLLLSAHPEKMSLVYETGIGQYVSTDFWAIREHFPEMSPDVEAKKHLRWAAFLREMSPETAVAVLRDLKLDNHTIAGVKTLVRWIGEELLPEKLALRRVISQIGTEMFDELLQLKRILLRENVTEIARLFQEICRDKDCLSLKELAVSGRDLMEAGVRPGKAVGENLEHLLALVLEDPACNQREYLLQHLLKSDIIDG